MDDPRILIVDDDPGVRESLETALSLEGFEVTALADGLQALAHLAQPSVDAVVLDIAMPYVDGVEVCRRIRADGNEVPILLLTARDGLDDRVAGLDAGADDYLVKPFALRELVARLRALLRRALSDRKDVATYADLRLDRSAHRAWRGERLLELTRTEFLLLECLLEHPEQVLERGQIQQRVWGYDFGRESNPLAVYISYLRRKLEAGGEPRLIQTVRAVGFVLRSEP